MEKLAQKRGKSLLLKFVQLRTNMTLSDIAKEMGVNYHSLIKVVNKLPHRVNPHIRNAVARRLNVAYDDLWGSEADERIKELITDEISRKAMERALKYQKELVKKTLAYQ